MNVLDLVKYTFATRRVWWFTASARTRARFARTIFGSFWLGLSNLLSIAVLALVYGSVFRVDDFVNYVMYLGFGLVLWNSLSSAITTAPNLLENQAALLKNTNLNPVFYTLEEWAFQLQTFSQSFILVFFALGLIKPAVWLHLFTGGLLPLANFILALYWIPVIVCLLGATYRDLYQLVPIVLQLLFLVSPILYKARSLGGLAWTADINLLYQFIAPFRDALLEGEVNIVHGLLMLVLNIAGILLSLCMINRSRPNLPFLV